MFSVIKNLKKPSLRTVIIGGFFMVMSFVIILFVASFFSVYQYNNNLRDVTYVRGFKAAIVSDMLATTYHRAQSTLLLYGRRYKDFNIFDDTYYKSSEDLNNAIVGFSKIETTVEQSKIIETIIAKSKEADLAHQQVFDYFSLYEDETPSPPVSIDEMTKLYESLDQSIKNLLEYEQVSWFREVSDSIDHHEKQYKIGMVLFLSVLLISLFVAWRVLQSAILAEKRLLKQKEYAQATLISIADGVITVDAEGRVRQINKTAQKLTGWSEDRAVGHYLSVVYQAKSLKTGLDIEHPAGNPLSGFDDGFDKAHYLFSKQKKIYEVESSYSVVRDNDQVAGAVLIFRDISESQEMSRRLKWQANHDALTGLINRNTFEKEIEKSIQEAVDVGTQFALLFIDLDQFKIVNDTCGHVAGDELLSQIGLIFEQQIRKTDVLARLGGDEFGILLYGCDDELAYSVSEKLLKAVSEFRFAWEEKVFAVGASIGFVIVDESSTNLSELMSAADMACYAAKESGRGQVKKYNSEISISATEMTMSAKINQAIDAGDFELHYQTILPLAEGSTDNICEVLVRMVSDGEIVLPNSFLPAAERFNLMRKVDRWIIDNIFKYIHYASRTQSSFRAKRYCINLSGASINDETLFDFIRDKISEYNIPTHHLCFEITETVAITNLSRAANLINQIKELGCTLSLDDFGTGASSFAYLKYLPVDYIKIDGTFIKDIIDDEIDLEIVSSIVKIAKVLGIKTVAEFVETEEILSKVKELGVDYAQGYVVSYPKKFDEIKALK